MSHDFHPNPNHSSSEGFESQSIHVSSDSFQSDGENHHEPGSDVYDNYYNYLAARDELTLTFGSYDEIFGPTLGNWTANPTSTAATVAEILPVLEFSGAGKNLVCPVCTEDFGMNENIRRLPCSHCYHKECIERWLRTRNNCPLCRYELSTNLGSRSVRVQVELKVKSRAKRNYF